MNNDDQLFDEVYREIENILKDEEYEYNPRLEVNIINGTCIEGNIDEIKRYLCRWYLVKVISFAIKDGLNQLNSFTPDLSTVPGAVLRLLLCYLRKESEDYLDSVVKIVTNPGNLSYESPMSILMDIQKCIYVGELDKIPTMVAKLLIIAGYNKNPDLYTDIEREILQDYIIVQLSVQYGMTKQALMDNCFPNVDIFKSMKFQDKLDSISIYSEQFSWNEF